MSNKFANGYLKWDGKKYVIEPTLDTDAEKSLIRVEEDNSRILYFYSGKCKIIQK